MSVLEKIATAREFERLGRRVQLGQLRRLASAALAAYDLGEVSLKLLAHLFNTTFRVDTAEGRRYVLRIHRAGAPTVESVGAELAWLAALRRDTTLEVPEPVPTRAGPLLTVAAAPGVSEPHICVLFRWLDGRRLDARLRPTHMERLGVLMARLQNHALEWGPPPGFARGRVDWPIEAARPLPDPFAPKIVAAIDTLVTETLSAEEAGLVTAVIERVRAAEEAMGRRTKDEWEAGVPATFGLIHADLHQYNLLFKGGEVRAIDFDDCGFGPLLFDLAVPLAMLQDRVEYPALRAALLEGYRRVRPLPTEHEAHLDTYIALRHVQDALWVVGRRKHPAIADDWAAQARQSLALIASL